MKNLFFSLLLVPFLLPLFFIPGGSVSFYASKITLLSLIVLVALALFVWTVLKEKALVIPKTFLLWTLAGLMAAYVLSTAFSSSFGISATGYGFETLTLLSIFVLSILCFVTAVTFQSVERIVAATLAFLLGALVLGVFHMVRFIFGAEALRLGFFDSVLANTIGSWNEFGIFFGAAALVSVAVLEGLRLRPLFRICSYVVAALSLLALLVVNFNLVWYAVAAASLIMALYIWGIFANVPKRIPYIALSLCCVALLCSVPAVSQRVASVVQKVAPANFIDVRPSLRATLSVGTDSLSANPVFGVGPNRFRNEWELYRPDVNSTAFWNYSFGASYGFVPTALIETGIVGIVAWLSFLLSGLWLIVRSLRAKVSNPSHAFVLMSSSVAALYFWIMNTVYAPGWVLLGLSFFFTGLAVAAAVATGLVHKRSIEIYRTKYVSGILLALSVVILVATASVTFVVFKRAYAASQFIQASVAFSKTGDISIADTAVRNIISIDPSDVYYRNAGEIDLLKINALVAEAEKDPASLDRVRGELQNILTHIVEVSDKAVQYDPDNFVNWLSAARVYATIAPLGLPEAYDTAIRLYEEAVKRSPKNPLIYLELARLEVGRRDYAKARQYIDSALNLKPNYTEAIFLLSQIDVTEGKNKQAIASTEKIALIAPNDPNIFFRLGLLKYGEKDYVGAVQAFERAIALVPEYANAEYFLGLSFYFTNRTADAIKSFEHLATTNPDNAEVKLILRNLKAGRAPFTGAELPIDSTPEDRPELPLKETKPLQATP